MDFIIGGIIGLVIGVAISKNVKRFWLNFRANPAAVIQKEIDELKALTDRYGKMP